MWVCLCKTLHFILKCTSSSVSIEPYSSSLESITAPLCCSSLPSRYISWIKHWGLSPSSLCASSGPISSARTTPSWAIFHPQRSVLHILTRAAHVLSCHPAALNRHCDQRVARTWDVEPESVQWLTISNKTNLLAARRHGGRHPWCCDMETVKVVKCNLPSFFCLRRKWQRKHCFCDTDRTGELTD